MEFGQILSLVLIALFYVIPLILKSQKKKNEEALKRQKQMDANRQGNTSSTPRARPPSSPPSRDRYTLHPKREDTYAEQSKTVAMQYEEDMENLMSLERHGSSSSNAPVAMTNSSTRHSLKKTPVKPNRALLGSKKAMNRDLHGKKKAPTRSLLGTKRSPTRELKGRKKEFIRASVNAEVDDNYSFLTKKSSRFSKIYESLSSKKDIIILSEIIKPYDR